ALDVVADVPDALVAELAVAQARDRVVLVEALQRLRGGLDVPFEERRAEAFGDLQRQHGLAGAGLALDQERPLQRDGGIDGDLQIVGRHIAAGSLETHARSACPAFLSRFGTMPTTRSRRAEGARASPQSNVSRVERRPAVRAATQRVRRNQRVTR